VFLACAGATAAARPLTSWIVKKNLAIGRSDWERLFDDQARDYAEFPSGGYYPRPRGRRQDQEQELKPLSRIGLAVTKIHDDPADEPWPQWLDGPAHVGECYRKNEMLRAAYIYGDPD
jgi:hypothetical protein